MLANKSVGSRLFDGFNYVFLLLFAMVTVIPFIYIFAGSFATSAELMQKGFILFPTKFSLAAYQYIFSTNTVLQSLGVTVFITVAGTLVNLLFTVLMAYPLARKDLPGRRWVMLLVLFSMLFSGGMIPTFLVVKSFGLLNTYWALLIPGAINAFNLIVMKNFFQ
ncbi:MAG: YtcP3, partial [Bacilli bacterium]|nr:YtcP3 [Bacilli bacterium]